MNAHSTNVLVSPTSTGTPAAVQTPAATALHEEPIQFKLTIGAKDDPLELEADTMADQVMRMPAESFVQRKCAQCEEEERVQRKCSQCEEEEHEEKVQRKPLASFIQ